MNRNSRLCVERRALTLEHDLAGAELIEGGCGGDLGRGHRVAGPEAIDGIVPEDPADHRCPLQRYSLGLRERVEPRLEHAAQRGRHVRFFEALVDHVPVVANRA